MKKLILFLIFAWGLLPYLPAQKTPQAQHAQKAQQTQQAQHIPGNPIHFKHLTLNDGLSQNSVFCILQDQQGFMWFGTQDGLNKYDGYTFTIYKQSPGDANTPSSNQMNVLFEDKDGFIWIGTDGAGLNKFDPKSETFTRYPYDGQSPNALKSGIINAITQDKQGNIWVGTSGGGLSKLAPKQNPLDSQERFKHYTKESKNPHSLRCNHILSLLVGHDGFLWIGTRDDGLTRLEPISETFVFLHNQRGNPSSLRHNRVNAIFEDKDKNLWVGTAGGGLNLLDKRTGRFYSFRGSREKPDTMAINFINTLYEDHMGILWIGTDNGGLIRFNKEKPQFTSYINIPYSPYSLSNNGVTAIFEDRSKVLWIGTAGGGLNYFHRRTAFPHYHAIPLNPNSLSDNFVTAIHEDQNGYLWIGSARQGLDRFNRKTGAFEHFRRTPGKAGSLVSNFINTIYEDSQGTLWIGTNGGGLNKYNRKRKNFTTYWNYNRQKRQLEDNDIQAIHEDRFGTLWVGTYRSGLCRFNKETQEFTSLKHDPKNKKSISDNSISVIYETRLDPGYLWIGTLNGGLNRFSIANETFESYQNRPGNFSSLSNNCVTTLCEDRLGNLWIGTYGGGINQLLRDERGKNNTNFHFIHFTEKDGLANNSVYGILEDDAGRLWISTNKGLSRFNFLSGTFKNYNARDGLQSDEFNGGAYFKSKRGELFFGGLNGFNAFYPRRIKDNPHIPPVVITSFKLFNKPVPISWDSPLKQSIQTTQELRLNYTQNAISFEFTALDFSNPKKNHYAYRMEGLDKEWIETGAQKRFASYTNLAPGEYTFRVKGSNNDETWNETGTAIKIFIAPPYWKTWWFRTLMVFLLLALILLGYRKRLQTVRIKTELQTAHDAQMSIMPQKDPEVEGFDISGICVPANEVGGDFFDYIWLNEKKEKLGIAIGDVSGKAMKSAMTAVMTSGMIYLKADESSSIKEILQRVNRPLYFKTDKKVFTALCLASLDMKNSELTFANAGLNDPLLKKGSNVSKIKCDFHQLPLGVKPDLEYVEKKCTLAHGDVVVFVTDGITESKNASGDFFGQQALETLLAEMETTYLTAAEIKNQIVAQIKVFSEGAHQHDDITVVVVKAQ